MRFHLAISVVTLLCGFSCVAAKAADPGIKHEENETYLMAALGNPDMLGSVAGESMMAWPAWGKKIANAAMPDAPTVTTRDSAGPVATANLNFVTSYRVSMRDVARDTVTSAWSSELSHTPAAVGNILLRLSGKIPVSNQSIPQGYLITPQFGLMGFMQPIGGGMLRRLPMAAENSSVGVLQYGSEQARGFAFTGGMKALDLANGMVMAMGMATPIGRLSVERGVEHMPTGSMLGTKPVTIVRLTMGSFSFHR